MLNRISMIAWVFFLTSSTANADCSYQLQQMIGWTIIQIKTIDGFQEPKKVKKSGFEGCNGDTTIFFTDGTYAKCMSLGLQLALMPKAIIFGKNSSYNGQNITLYKMLVDGRTYDIMFY